MRAAWKWIKDGLAVALRGRGGQIIWEEAAERIVKKGQNRESVFCYCVSGVCRKLCNLFKCEALLLSGGLCQIDFKAHQSRLTVTDHGQVSLIIIRTCEAVKVSSLTFIKKSIYFSHSLKNCENESRL